MRTINGQRNQGIFSIEKNVRELTMTLMRLIAIKYFNRLTALINTFSSQCSDGDG